jgi:pyruvate,water dikinase
MNRFVIPLASPQAVDPDCVGPKAANLATLARAGLPTPGGFCLTAAAYRHQIAALGLDGALAQFDTADPRVERRLSVEIRLGLYEQPIVPEIADPLLAVWQSYRTVPAASAGPWAVRSSALIEDRADANFAGQFESFLGIDNEPDLLTTIRACWAALWTTNARRYMANHGLKPSTTAMGVLIQRLVVARASGGGLSETAEGNMLLSATWGLGSAIAQGQVVLVEYQPLTPSRRALSPGAMTVLIRVCPVFMSLPATGDFDRAASWSMAGTSAVRLGAALANGRPSLRAAYA